MAIKNAKVKGISKNYLQRWILSVVFDSHTGGEFVLTDKEACALKIGDTIEIDAEWNQDGWGQEIELPRPITVVESKTKVTYRTIE